MPDNNMTREALDVPGASAPDLLNIAKLFAALTPQERAQAWAFLASLRQKRSA